MIKLIIYYGLIFILSAFLVTPFIVQRLLQKLLKKLNFSIKIAGFFTYQNIKLQVKSANTIFQSVQVSIGSLALKKVPKKLGLAICIEKPVIKLGLRSLDLFFTGNISNLQRMATSDSDHNQIVSNSLEILNFVREIYDYQTKKPPVKVKNSSLEKKKKSINDNTVFFKQMFLRLLIMAVMKLLVIEVTDCEFEVFQELDKNKKEEPKSACKFEIGKFDAYFEYQKVRPAKKFYSLFVD